MLIGCLNIATSTNAWAMTPFGMSNSILDYVYFTLEYFILFPYDIAVTWALSPISISKTKTTKKNDEGILHVF